MLLRELFEADGKTAVIGWGRMNPPTIGHSVLVNAINAKAKQYGGDPMLFLTMSHLAKGATKSYLTPKGKTNKHFQTAGIKNPLDWKTKLGYAQSFYKIPISTDPSLNTIMSVMKHLETKGYKKVVLVAGSDRVREFETQILPYNNTADQSGNVNFNIKEVSVEEGGFRDEEANDASGMSASKMREAAAQDDFESFKQGVPNQKLAKQMFDDVREGLGFNHQTDEGLDEEELAELKVQQQRPKIDVINNIADRKDSKPFPLSYKDTGGASSGGEVLITPQDAQKFIKFYDSRSEDEQELMQKALKSVNGTVNLLKNLGMEANSKLPNNPDAEIKSPVDKLRANLAKGV
tara:strand:+ start:387 stop:1430 length:1044 start_codon:yes stop_codon:yes gene_type:complete